MRSPIRVESKVDGGYAKVTAAKLVAVFWSYINKVIGRNELRVWFAALELAERRRFTETKTKKARKPCFKLAEFARVVGCEENEAYRSLKKLESVGVLSSSDGSLRFGRVVDLGTDLREQVREQLETVSMPKRLVPLPRSVIALIAAGETTKVETATLLGHAIRCLFLKDGNKVGLTGSVKASWVAEVFGVSASNIRSARARLQELGVWTEVEMAQTYTNQWGSRIEWNPNFVEPGKKRKQEAGKERLEGVEKSGAASRNQDAPPAKKATNQDTHKDQTLLPKGEAKNQTLAGSASARTGVSEQEPEGKKATVGPEKADLRNVQSSDLGNPTRLLELHLQAAALGLVPETERGRLLVFSAAERAIAKGTKNAPGLFVWCLRSGGKHISGPNEDAALRSLKNLDGGGGGGRRERPTDRELGEASERRAQLARLELQQRLGEPLSETTLRWMRTQKQELEQSSEKPLGQLAHHLLEKLLWNHVGCHATL